MIQFNKNYFYKGEVVVPLFMDGDKVACANINGSTLLVRLENLKEIKEKPAQKKVVEYIKKENKIVEVPVPAPVEVKKEEPKAVFVPPVEVAPAPAPVSAPTEATPTEKKSSKKKGAVVIKSVYDDYI